MNELIKKELQNCKVALIPNLDDDATLLLIPKGTRNCTEIVFEKGKFYKVRFANYIVHPYEGFNLHIQWNNNIPPKEDIMNVEVLEIMGKMIKLNCTGCEHNSVWVGWVPISSVTILNII